MTEKKRRMSKFTRGHEHGMDYVEVYIGDDMFLRVSCTDGRGMLLQTRMFGCKECNECDGDGLELDLNHLDRIVSALILATTEFDVWHDDVDGWPDEYEGEHEDPKGNKLSMTQERIKHLDRDDDDEGPGEDDDDGYPDEDDHDDKEVERPGEKVMKLVLDADVHVEVRDDAVEGSGILQCERVGITGCSFLIKIILDDEGYIKFPFIGSAWFEKLRDLDSPGDEVAVEVKATAEVGDYNAETIDTVCHFRYVSSSLVTVSISDKDQDFDMVGNAVLDMKDFRRLVEFLGGDVDVEDEEPDGKSLFEFDKDDVVNALEKVEIYKKDHEEDVEFSAVVNMKNTKASVIALGTICYRPDMCDLVVSTGDWEAGFKIDGTDREREETYRSLWRGGWIAVVGRVYTAGKTNCSGIGRCRFNREDASFIIEVGSESRAEARLLVPNFEKLVKLMQGGTAKEPKPEDDDDGGDGGFIAPVGKVGSDSGEAAGGSTTQLKALMYPADVLIETGKPADVKGKGSLLFQQVICATDSNLFEIRMIVEVGRLMGTAVFQFVEQEDLERLKSFKKPGDNVLVSGRAYLKIGSKGTDTKEATCLFLYLRDLGVQITIDIEIDEVGQCILGEREFKKLVASLDGGTTQESNDVQGPAGAPDGSIAQGLADHIQSHPFPQDESENRKMEMMEWIHASLTFTDEERAQVLQEWENQRLRIEAKSQGWNQRLEEIERVVESDPALGLDMEKMAVEMTERWKREDGGSAEKREREDASKHVAAPTFSDEGGMMSAVSEKPPTNVDHLLPLTKMASDEALLPTLQKIRNENQSGPTPKPASIPYWTGYVDCDACKKRTTGVRDVRGGKIWCQDGEHFVTEKDPEQKLDEEIKQWAGADEPVGGYIRDKSQIDTDGPGAKTLVNLLGELGGPEGEALANRINSTKGILEFNTNERALLGRMNDGLKEGLRELRKRGVLPFTHQQERHTNISDEQMDAIVEAWRRPNPYASEQMDAIVEAWRRSNPYASKPATNNLCGRPTLRGEPCIETKPCLLHSELSEQEKEDRCDVPCETKGGDMEPCWHQLPCPTHHISKTQADQAHLPPPCPVCGGAQHWLQAGKVPVCRACNRPLDQDEVDDSAPDPDVSQEAWSRAVLALDRKVLEKVIYGQKLNMREKALLARMKREVASKSVGKPVQKMPPCPTCGGIQQWLVAPNDILLRCFKCKPLPEQQREQKGLCVDLKKAENPAPWEHLSDDVKKLLLDPDQKICPTCGDGLLWTTSEGSINLRCFKCKPLPEQQGEENQGLSKRIKWTLNNPLPNPELPFDDERIPSEEELKEKLLPFVEPMTDEQAKINAHIEGKPWPPREPKDEEPTRGDETYEKFEARRDKYYERYKKGPYAVVDLCAFAEGKEEASCKLCEGTCPDKEAIKRARRSKEEESLADVLSQGNKGDNDVVLKKEVTESQDHLLEVPVSGYTQVGDICSHSLTGTMTINYKHSIGLCSVSIDLGEDGEKDDLKVGVTEVKIEGPGLVKFEEFINLKLREAYMDLQVECGPLLLDKGPSPIPPWRLDKKEDGPSTVGVGMPKAEMEQAQSKYTKLVLVSDAIAGKGPCPNEPAKLIHRPGPPSLEKRWELLKVAERELDDFNRNFPDDIVESVNAKLKADRIKLEQEEEGS